MPKSKYDSIYQDLKKKIESDVFSYQELLPSENTLIQLYECSRNTVRRAIGKLVSDGYVPVSYTHLHFFIYVCAFFIMLFPACCPVRSKSKRSQYISNTK